MNECSLAGVCLAALGLCGIVWGWVNHDRYLPWSILAYLAGCILWVSGLALFLQAGVVP